ncbi:hypothetical protein BC831DRAFT_476473 [Entophlyctis helioformis]|nr:hypothetical protein BC831DRAFT_476473 [Entophlyctis helioformis]
MQQQRQLQGQQQQQQQQQHPMAQAHARMVYGRPEPRQMQTTRLPSTHSLASAPQHAFEMSRSVTLPPIMTSQSQQHLPSHLPQYSPSDPAAAVHASGPSSAPLAHSAPRAFNSSMQAGQTASVQPSPVTSDPPHAAAPGPVQHAPSATTTPPSDPAPAPAPASTSDLHRQIQALTSENRALRDRLLAMERRESDALSALQTRIDELEVEKSLLRSMMLDAAGRRDLD